jgi:hypothetical protein
VDFTLPPLFIDKKARAVKGDYDKLRRATDTIARQQEKMELAADKLRQANLRKNVRTLLQREATPAQHNRAGAPIWVQANSTSSLP